jgi:hypothetical protein
VRILRFGKTGRIAHIAQRACEVAFSKPDFITYQRTGGYVHEATNNFFANLQSCVRSFDKSQFLVIDASIDHSNIDALTEHESFKREAVLWLSKENLLSKVVGFSSGISLLNQSQIDASALHMIAYREQKLIQQSFFQSLSCQFYLPNVFTLLGPITYGRQSAAWAQVLKARVNGETQFVINDPYSERLWVSEYSVFMSLLNFLRSIVPNNISGALVDGLFTLDEIASNNFIEDSPSLHYIKGSNNGWLIGDYKPPGFKLLGKPIAIYPELTRSLLY